MKILIVWHDRPSNKNLKGGAEEYIKTLINFFKLKNIEIDYLYTNETKEFDIYENVKYIKVSRMKKTKNLKCKKNKFINIMFLFFWTIKNQLNENKNEKLINGFIKKNINDHLVINNMPIFSPKKIRTSKNFIVIQHTDYTVYEKFFFYNRLNLFKYPKMHKLLLSLLKNTIIFNKNILQKTKNVVFYSNDKKYLEINKNVLVGSIPIQDTFFQQNNNWYLEKKSKNSIVYFGRFDNEQKNLKLLSYISKKGNLNIDLYGYGKYEAELRKNSLLNIKGKIININDKINILSEYDMAIITSDYEGICISAIELLSMGVIAIIRNSFLEAKNLIPKKYHNLLLINSNVNANVYIEKINYLKNISTDAKNEIRINLINHMKNNYSIKKFENNWEIILKKLNFYKGKKLI